MPLTEFLYCVSVAFTMTERANQVHHDNAPANSTALVQVLWQSIISPRSVNPPTAQIWLPATFGVFSPKAKIPVEIEEIFECDGHKVHKISQRHLTADWLVPRESDCWRMNKKVSSDWLPSYIKVTSTVLEIFKMPQYFPDSPRIHLTYVNSDLIWGQKFRWRRAIQSLTTALSRGVSIASYRALQPGRY
jgi:hypothetical protein